MNFPRFPSFSLPNHRTESTFAIAPSSWNFCRTDKGGQRKDFQRYIQVHHIMNHLHG